MTFELRDWQLHDQEVLKKHNYVSLLNMEPGAGKTVTSLFAHKNSGSEVTLIVAPQNAHQTAWIKDAVHIDQEVRVIGNKTKATKQATQDFQMGYEGIYLTTPQYLTRADVDTWFGDMLIIDEGHMLNKYGGKGCNKMLSLTESFEGRLFLSGTAFRNSFERAWATGRLLWPELDRRDEVANQNYYLWLRERMTSEEVYTKRDERTGESKKVTKWLVEAEQGRWINEVPSVITHKKREHCCDFHPNGFLDLEEPQVNVQVIDLDRQQKQVIKDLEDQYLAWLDENPLIVDLPIVMQQRIRQVCLGVPEVENYLGEDSDGNEVEKQRLWFKDNSKSPFAEFLIEELHQSDEPVVVYLDSQIFASVLVKKLHAEGITAFEFSGKTVKTRDADFREFGKKYRVMVAVISAAGTGTDGIQNVTSTEYWLERSVDETANVQGESRADRWGAKKQVQRNIIQDSEGYAAGRLSRQLEKRLAMNRSLRRNV